MTRTTGSSRRRIAPFVRSFAVGIASALALAAPAAAAEPRYTIANGCYLVGGQPTRFQAATLGEYLLVRPDGSFDETPVAYTNAQARALKKATGCATFPEADTDVEGLVTKGSKPWAATRGLIDSHFHWMAADMFGGKAHCGRAWSPLGVAKALTDCPDHEPGGGGLTFENVLSGNSPTATHDMVGWPTFKDWPNRTSLTHENAYYKWVERAYRGGLRLTVVLFFDNAQLCGLWPTKDHDCDEMASVRREVGLLKDLQAYIDAQNGGPGRGWMRIVRSPFEARRVINQGKLAVVMGIETSRLFDCTVRDGTPGCTNDSIDQQLAAARKLGIRSLEITGKFDNALAGVAGDPGTNGVVTNTGNKLETGSYLRMGSCAGLPSGAVDQAQLTALPAGSPLGLLAGSTPVYPPPPHCNQLGLSDLGAHLINRMADTRTILDPDHMAAIARIKALDIMSDRGYSGLISSHSWSTPVDEPRIVSLGGVVFPKASAIAKSSTPDWFAGEYERLRKLRDPKYAWGFGYGSDINGIAKQPSAGGEPKVTYPFRSYDGKQTIREMTTGERTWNYNIDGVANYGLYLDWLQQLRQQLGEGFVRDMRRGPEAYLQMWERAYGVPSQLAARPRVGWTAGKLLRRSGQPRVRGARVWRYADGTRVKLSRRGRVVRVR